MLWDASLNAQPQRISKLQQDFFVRPVGPLRVLQERLPQPQRTLRLLQSQPRPQTRPERATETMLEDRPRVRLASDSCTALIMSPGTAQALFVTRAAAKSSTLKMHQCDSDAEQSMGGTCLRLGCCLKAYTVHSRRGCSHEEFCMTHP